MTNPSSSTSASEQGMTLIEVLIAIAILGFIMVAVVGITDNAYNTKDRTTRINADNLSAETALARLEADFTQIWSPLYFSQPFNGTMDPNTNPGVVEMVYLYERHPRLKMPSKEGLPIPIYRSREKSEFIFLTSANRRRVENQKQSQYMWVRYYLGDSAQQDVGDGVALVSGSKKALLRQTFSDDVWSKEEFDFEGTRASVLLDNVEEMEFQFWSPRTRKWETNLTTLPENGLVQRGLQITLKWTDSQGFKRSTIRWMRPLWPTVFPNDQATPTQPTQPGQTPVGTPPPAKTDELEP